MHNVADDILRIFLVWATAYEIVCIFGNMQTTDARLRIKWSDHGIAECTPFAFNTRFFVNGNNSETNKSSLSVGNGTVKIMK